VEMLSASTQNADPLTGAGLDQTVSTFVLVTLESSGSNDLDGDLTMAFV